MEDDNVFFTSEGMYFKGIPLNEDDTIEEVIAAIKPISDMLFILGENAYYSKQFPIYLWFVYFV